MSYSTQYILGIKTSGFSMKIDSLEFGSDQSKYDYICNVNLSSGTMAMDFLTLQFLIKIIRQVAQ